MASAALQPIKLVFRFLFQLYFQPSKVYDFIKAANKNRYIFIGSLFPSGLLIGFLLAIPYVILYKDFPSGGLFVISCALNFMAAVVFSGAGVGAFGLPIAAAAVFSGIGSLNTAFIIAGSFAGAVSAVRKSPRLISNAFTMGVLNVGSFAIAGLSAFGLAKVFASTGAENLLTKLFPSWVYLIILFFPMALWFILVYFLLYEENKFQIKEHLVQWILFLVCFLMLFMGARLKIQYARHYEMIIYPIAFLAGYLFSSSFYFIDRKKTHQNFWVAQKSSLVWAPLIATIILLIDFPKQGILTVVWGFALLPLFILHVPDYFLCLPLWLRQRKNILERKENSKESVNLYEESILFKHERLYFQLPGLHRVILSFAQHKALGIEEAVKHIDYLYQHTFQGKQAEKAAKILIKDEKTSHQYIHFLLEGGNLSRVHQFAEPWSLPELYLELFEDKEEHEGARSADFTGRLETIYRKMEEKQGYRCNSEMTETLRIAHEFLKARNLKSFYEACTHLEKIIDFPLEITFFLKIQQMIPRFRTIKENLVKTGSIELFETRRSVLKLQKESLNNLAKTAEENFYEPFGSLWRNVLIHCAELVEQEIKFLLDSASLSIELKNNEILLSKDERKLYFNIHNKGRGVATDILIILQTDNPEISFSRNTDRIPTIEAGKAKEIYFPFSAFIPATVTITGTVTFSDLVMENKQLPFSFPITITKVKTSEEFREITNPYYAGRALSSDNTLFYGREDAYKFIDKNIMAFEEHHTIVCYGLRKTGKTSLLKRIEKRGFTDKRLVPILFDMQGIDDEGHFYSELARVIVERLSLKTSTASKNFSEFKQFLREIKAELGEKIIVLMMDEFEEIKMRVEQKEISSTVFSNIRHLMQHENKLIFLFCGTHELVEMSIDYRSIFFSVLNYKISNLQKEEARRLIEKPLEGQVKYDPLAIDQIFKMTNGQPFLTQLVCKTIIDTLNEYKKRNYVVIDDVDDAVEHIISGGNDHFSQHIWEDSNILERLILSAAAEELTGKQLDSIGFETICEKIESVTSKFSRKQKLEVLDKLVSKDILKGRDMFYSFPINLLRKWITFRYPLRKVREEI